MRIGHRHDAKCADILSGDGTLIVYIIYIRHCHVDVSALWILQNDFFGL